MKIKPLPLKDAWIIDIDPAIDHRGFFARTFCEDFFLNNELNTHWPQMSLSFNEKKGTLRGLHYQISPYEECKLVRCTQGALWDVIVDLRPTSITYLKWTALELTDQNRRALYIPAGMAHGFQTLTDNTEIHYQISARYEPHAARGIRWNDPFFSVDWPLENPILSDRDQHYPDFVTSA